MTDEPPDRRRTARVQVNQLVSIGTVDDDGDLQLRERRMVDVGVGGCAIRGESVRAGTHVAVFVNADLIIVGRAIPPTPGEDVTRLEWAADTGDVHAIRTAFGPA